MLSDGEMQALLQCYYEKAKEVDFRKKRILATLREIEREVRQQGGRLAVSMLRFQVKLSDPEAIDDIKAKIRAQLKASRFMGHDLIATVEEPRPRPHIVRPQVPANAGETATDNPPEAA